MNDLITAATSGLFVEVGKVIEHMKAQQARIADLERQLAAPSAPAIEQQFKLDNIEQYRQQMAGISTAALGYWEEGDRIHPDYDTIALRDVAKLYAKYDALYKAAEAATPRAADTDKVREALPELPMHIHTHPVLGKLYDRIAMHCYGVKCMDMAAQAPVREVIYQMQHRGAPTVWTDIDSYAYQTAMAGGLSERVRMVSPLPAAPVQPDTDKEQA